MAETLPLFVCRPTDVAVLRAQLDQARSGTARTVVIEAPMGGGKRAAVGELLRGVAEGEDTVVVRAALSDEEDGLRTTLRLYAALLGALQRDTALRGRVEMHLNTALPKQDKRVQGWIQAFVEGMKKAVPNEGETSFQVSLPRDNPILGFGEIVGVIASQVTVVLDIQNVHNSHSISTFAMLEGMLQKHAATKLLVILTTEPTDGAARGWMPAPWLDFLERKAGSYERLVLAPWDAEEVLTYASTKGLSVAAPARIAALTGGRPAFIAELIDLLNEQGKLDATLEDVTLLDLTPAAADEDEVPAEVPAAKEGERKKASQKDVGRVQYLAALLGLVFPSGLVADMDGWDRDSVDDLFDGCGDLVKELQFSQPFGTWLYQFKRGIFRQAILDANTNEEGAELARRVGSFMERFLMPRGYEFAVKTIRMYGEHGAQQRAAVLRANVLGNDRPDVWAMTRDVLAYHGSIAWPEPMVRTTLVHLGERMIQSGEVEQAERLLQEALAFARTRNDKGMEAWGLFAGSRLDFRRSDLYRARDRAKDALRAFQALEDTNKAAEVCNHLAMVEYQDGNANASMDHLRLALETANVPPIQANVEYIRGLLARRQKKLPEAAEHFRKSNEVAGQIGMAPLALEAGFHYGETLILSQQHTKAADVLTRVAQIAQALQNPARERATVALLAQAQGALRNFEAALQMANRTLQLTQQLKFDRLLAVDIFNVGYFNLMLGRATEAASLFAKSRERASADDPAFLRELTFHSGLASLRIGEAAQAGAAFQQAFGLAQKTKDLRKVVGAADNLAALALAGGDKSAAKRWLEEAVKAAEAGNLREERKALRKKLDEIA